MVSSEWGLPPQYENGVVAEDLLSNKYGHSIHFWDLRARKNIQTIDFGENYQMALEIRPAHDPSKSYGFCGVVVDTTNLQGAIFTWWRDDGGVWQSKKVITIMCSDIHRLVILPQLYSTPLRVLSSLLEKEPPVLGIRPPSQCDGGGQHHHQQDG